MTIFKVKTRLPRFPNTKTSGPRIRKIVVDGVELKLPSVTTILDAVIAKPELVQWRINTACEDVIQTMKEVMRDNPGKSPEEIEEEARWRIGDQWKDRKIATEAARVGTHIHSLIQRHLQKEMGTDVSPHEGEWSDLAQIGFDAWLRWRDNQDFIPLALETVTYSQAHMFSGQYDCRAVWDGKVTVFDWKPPKLYPSYRYQVSAYCLAEQERGIQGIEKAACVGIPRDGSEIEDKNVWALSRQQIQDFSEEFVVLKRMYDRVEKEKSGAQV